MLQVLLPEERMVLRDQTRVGGKGKRSRDQSSVYIIRMTFSTHGVFQFSSNEDKNNSYLTQS